MLTHIFRMLIALAVGVSYAADTVAADDHAAHGGHGAAAHPPAVATGVTSLDVYADGSRLHVLTAVRDGGGGPRLQYVHSNDGGVTWSAAVDVPDAGTAPQVTRGADAHVAAAGDRLVAAWTAHSATDRFGSGGLATAVSGDGGRTWRVGPNPVDDPSDAGRAFVDVAAGADGTFHLVWLDTRPTAGAPSNGQGLRYARSTDAGQTWSPNRTLVASTCECCWNTLAAGPGGRVAVLFRQRNPRDMGIVTSSDDGRTWGGPVTVGAFGWGVDGCPHVGGGLAFATADPIDPVANEGAGGVACHAVVWTAKGDGATGAFVLGSADGAASWSPPQQLGGDARSWHADVAAGPGGRLAAVWDAHDGTKQVVRATRSDDGGRTWSPPAVFSATDVSATHPRVVWIGDGFRAFWTERSIEAAAVSVWSNRKL